LGLSRIRRDSAFLRSVEYVEAAGARVAHVAARLRALGEVLLEALLAVKEALRADSVEISLSYPWG